MNYENYLDEIINRYKFDLSKKSIQCNKFPEELLNTDAIILAALASEKRKIISKKIIDFIKSNNSNFQDINKDSLKIGLEKIVMGNKPSFAFEFLRNTNLLTFYYPWLAKCYGVEQNEYHAHDVYYHSIYSCDAAVKNLEIKLAALFHDVGKVKAKRKIQKGEDEKDVFYNHEIIGSSIAYNELKKLNFEKQILNKVSKLVRYHMFHYTNEWTDNAVRRFIRNAKDNIDDLFLLRDADRHGNGKRIGGSSIQLREFKKRIKQIIEFDNRTTTKDLNINGYDLIKEFNLEEGPIIGKILRHLLQIIEKNEKNNERSFLLQKTQEYLNDINE